MKKGQKGVWNGIVLCTFECGVKWGKMGVIIPDNFPYFSRHISILFLKKPDNEI
jgi:hypothetical protein